MRFVLLVLINVCFTMSLQEAYNNSSSYGEYDKYLILEPGQIYYGGLGIYEGDVFIDCKAQL